MSCWAPRLAKLGCPALSCHPSFIQYTGAYHRKAVQLKTPSETHRSDAWPHLRLHRAQHPGKGAAGKGCAVRQLDGENGLICSPAQVVDEDPAHAGHCQQGILLRHPLHLHRTRASRDGHSVLAAIVMMLLVNAIWEAMQLLPTARKASQQASTDELIQMAGQQKVKQYVCIFDLLRFGKRCSIQRGRLFCHALLSCTSEGHLHWQAMVIQIKIGKNELSHLKQPSSRNKMRTCLMKVPEAVCRAAAGSEGTLTGRRSVTWPLLSSVHTCRSTAHTVMSTICIVHCTITLYIRSALRYARRHAAGFWRLKVQCHGYCLCLLVCHCTTSSIDMRMAECALTMLLTHLQARLQTNQSITNPKLSNNKCVASL